MRAQSARGRRRRKRTVNESTGSPRGYLATVRSRGDNRTAATAALVGHATSTGGTKYYAAAASTLPPVICRVLSPRRHAYDFPPVCF